MKQAAPDRVHVSGEDGSFSLIDGTPTENVHLAFPADDDAAVDGFHRALVAAGYRDDGGPRASAPTTTWGTTARSPSIPIASF